MSFKAYIKQDIFVDDHEVNKTNQEETGLIDF